MSLILSPSPPHSLSLSPLKRENQLTLQDHNDIIIAIFTTR